MGHGRIYHHTTHGSWVCTLLYDPWVMGAHTIVRPMGHGRIYYHTTHGSWVCIPLYDPWVMGVHTIVQPMGHGRIYYRTTHGLWVCTPLYDPWSMGEYTTVQPMRHGVYVLSYDPWVMVNIYPQFGRTTHNPWARTPHTHRTTHGPWTINSPSFMGRTVVYPPMGLGSYNVLYDDVWPMTHGKLSRRMTHDPWEKSC